MSRLGIEAKDKTRQDKAAKEKHNIREKTKERKANKKKRFGKRDGKTSVGIEGHSSYAQSHKFCNVLPNKTGHVTCNGKHSAFDVHRNWTAKNTLKVFLLKSNCGVSQMQSASV